MYDYHSRSHSPRSPILARVVGRSSAVSPLPPSWMPPASLPKTGLNACETLKELAASSKGSRPSLSNTRQLWPLGHIAARQSPCRKRCRRGCPCAGRDEPDPRRAIEQRTNYKALERVLKARRELAAKLGDAHVMFQMRTRRRPLKTHREKASRQSIATSRFPRSSRGAETLRPALSSWVWIAL